MSVLDAREPESDELQIICKPQPTPIVAFPFSRAFIGITGLRLGLWGGLATLPRGGCERLLGGQAARRACSRSSQRMLGDLGPEDGALGRAGPSCAHTASSPAAHTGLKPQPGLLPWASLAWLRQLTQRPGACAWRQRGTPSSSSTKTRVRGTGSHSPLGFIARRERTHVGNGKRTVLSSLCQHNTGPFPVAPGASLLPPSCSRACRPWGAQGALYASRKSHLAQDGFAPGHGGIRGRAVPGGAFQTPNPAGAGKSARSSPRCVRGGVAAHKLVFRRRKPS